MSSPQDGVIVDVSTPEGLVDAFVNHGVTLAALKGVSEAQLEALYTVAHGHLSEGRVDEALDDLLLLVTNNPWDRRFQFAFALALQMSGQYKEAGEHYSQALLLDATDAACVMRMGECLEATGNATEAEDAFRACIQLSYLKPEYHDVRAHAEARLAALSGGAA
ncbi:tetratricopeptide repeat protein [Pigmentiphaga aceris]|uniref:Tetratricopeptide repeat protein n=1 Tax=Pigmentiphaga aceris TaxID=1940612 RepID=A0A5C0AV14_9BURK|nr:tetratricopeptide repeat protein [Pigmentiphaga aceris]QEI06025.1 tetratricopeptide repeat protein [Pigmentiphaga aceris]